MPTPLPLETIANLRRQYPRLREDYFDYLTAVGWGDTDAGLTIYSGPTEPDEIYGPRDEHAGIVLLGDDFQGYCFGYNTETECYGEISDDGHWEPWPRTQGILHYVTEPEDKLDSYATGTNHSEHQHSMRGIASVIIGLAGSPPIVLVFTIVVSRFVGWTTSGRNPGPGGPGYGMFVPPEVLLIIAWFYLSPLLCLTGLVLGIAEIRKTEQKTFFPAAWITLAAFLLILWLLFFAYSIVGGAGIALVTAFGMGLLIFRVCKTSKFISLRSVLVGVATAATFFGYFTVLVNAARLDTAGAVIFNVVLILITMIGVSASSASLAYDIYGTRASVERGAIYGLLGYVSIGALVGMALAIT